VKQFIFKTFRILLELISIFFKQNIIIYLNKIDEKYQCYSNRLLSSV